MKGFRTALFWSHLAAGTLAGVVIFIMSATGALLALQPQILDWLERDVKRVSVPVGAARLPLSEIVQRAMVSHPGGTPQTVAVDKNPTHSVSVSYGREDVLYVNPYDGRVLGGGAVRARAAFQTLTEWHRYIGYEGEARPIARAFTGAGNLAFLGLAITGLYLWMPKTWTLARLRSIMAFDIRARGKARDFNWHNAIGFWCAPIIIVLTMTGAVLSYPWANALLYQVTGTPVPQTGGGGGGRQGGPGGGAAGGRQGGPGGGAAGGRQGGPGGGPRDAAQSPRDSAATSDLDAALGRVADVMPTWDTVSMRLAPQGAGPISMTLTDGSHWNKFARSSLTVRGAAADVVRWEPYSQQNAGQRLRGWFRFGHTGELGGFVGQVVAGIASAGGAFLVWTGISLALRRFVNWRQSMKRSVRRAA